ncbi:hypothetical protein G6O69_00495 [Pseudenhygromyxa sp. WMMC2535]|uniref:hypothetical protein n=1 Tax=Pseudenhygromyxa sp. WMMC2535 TaxID=2712867 RepID=UPI0015568E58|nr:hypothetical protein [Pseudenhygromyxa sp. WMMC2535]NVB36289.1 hypothetical protein [Pseudenhygromyxa sp. WMMC2535]
MRVCLAAGFMSLSLLGTLGCKPSAPAKEQVEKEPAEAPAKEAEADADDDAADEGANFAQPRNEPSLAPEGAVTIEDPWLYVQTCAEPNPCPEALQPAGDAHCSELVLGGRDGWRLPSKDEVSRFAGVKGLEATEGYHWTRTPFAEDNKQVWIVDFADPAAAPATTIPRDRKPFRVRCVMEP